MTFTLELRSELVAILGPNWVRDDAVTRYAYRCDGLTLHPGEAMGVVFPADTLELQAVVRALHKRKIPFLPRGAGTGLSGGAIPSEGVVILEMFRMSKIHEFDPENRLLVAGPGVVNLRLSELAAPFGLHFVPDPSSQKACTLGGNVGENSGGPHTLKYGVTLNHVLGIEVVLADGSCVNLGGKAFGMPGPDLLGLFIGSEGTFGIASKITCKLTPKAEAVHTFLASFSSVGRACECVSALIRSGIVPAALELIDQLVIEAVNLHIGAELPEDAAAVLIVELEGLEEGLFDERVRVLKILRQFCSSEPRLAQDEAQRKLIWRARKEAFGAIGAICPSFYTQDGVIPRSKLAEVLDEILAIGKKHELRIANVFHAGDGNLHPLILYNAKDPNQLNKVIACGTEILDVCLKVGGALSGEHGIGLEKSFLMRQMYAEDDLENMKRVKAAFNPDDLLNPGKIFPQAGRCTEVRFIAGKQGAMA